jgi:acetyl esterase
MLEEITYRLKAYIYKAISAFFEVIGRKLVFNLWTPGTGREVLDVQYGRANRRKQSLDIFVPPGRPPYPVMVYMHGSGFHAMDKKSYRRICRCFSSRGYLVFSINYRLAPASGFPEPVQDAASAISWAREHASQYGGDPEAVFLAGDSAGAYLASMYGAVLGDPRLMSGLGIERTVPADSIKGLLLFYGAFDMMSCSSTRFPFIKLLLRGFMGPDWQSDPRKITLASPQRHVAPGYPPCYIFAGAWDPLCSESRQFDRVLTRSGVPHETLIFGRRYPTANHGFLSMPYSKCSKLAMDEATAFMQGLA